MRSTTKRDFELAQAVSELAALLEYRGKRSEASILRSEATSLLIGGTDRGRQESLQRDRIRGGVATAMALPLAPDEQAIAERLAVRIQVALRS